MEYAARIRAFENKNLFTLFILNFNLKLINTSRRNDKFGLTDDDRRYNY